MSVTLQTVDLVQPLGELDCNFFPDADMDAKLGGWLKQAKTKVLADTSIKADNHNDATKSWVYYLAYSYIAGRFAAMPSSASVNKGADSVSYAQDRPAYWNSRALLAKAVYDGFAIVTTTTNRRESVAIPFQVNW